MLAARDLSYRYPGGTTALSAVSLEIGSGDRVALIGANGSGKSTLCRALIGAIEPTSGEALVGGKRASALAPRERAGRIAYVAPAGRFGSPLPVRRVLELGRRLRPRGDTVVSEVVERLELGELLEESVWDLSEGQRQRVSLGRAAAQVWDSGEAALVADEATAAMDPRFSVLALELFAALSERGVAVAAAMHDLTLARRFATSAVVLGPGGRLLASGRADDAMSPTRLREAFGIDFFETDTPAGPMVTATRH